MSKDLSKCPFYYNKRTFKSLSFKNPSELSMGNIVQHQRFDMGNPEGFVIVAPPAIDGLVVIAKRIGSPPTWSSDNHMTAHISDLFKYPLVYRNDFDYSIYKDDILGYTLSEYNEHLNHEEFTGKVIKLTDEGLLLNSVSINSLDFTYNVDKSQEVEIKLNQISRIMFDFML